LLKALQQIIAILIIFEKISTLNTANNNMVEQTFTMLSYLFSYDRPPSLTDEKGIIKELIEGMLLKHDAKRWTQSPWNSERVGLQNSSRGK